MARTYKRDSRGRFAGGGGSSSRGGGRKPMQRGTNRLTRDNAGRITSVGGDGATARGGRLRTASGKQRATVTAKGIGRAPAGTVGRSGKVKAPARVKAKPAAAAKPARVAQGAGRATVVANRATKPRTMTAKARTGADLVRRFDRLNDGSIAKGNPTATSPVTRRQRALRNATDPTARRTAQRKLDRAMATQSRAIGFRNAMAETRLGYSGRVKTKEGQDTLAGNFAKRPRYSTKQRIRPSWAR